MNRHTVTVMSKALTKTISVFRNKAETLDFVGYYTEESLSKAIIQATETI